MICGYCPCPESCAGNRFCDLLNPSHPSYDERYRDLACGGNAFVEYIGHDHVDSPVVSASDLELYKRMHGCHYRRVIEGECPDCRGLCTDPAKIGVKERADCFACLQSED